MLRFSPFVIYEIDCRLIHFVILHIVSKETYIHSMVESLNIEIRDKRILKWKGGYVIIETDNFWLTR